MCVGEGGGGGCGGMKKIPPKVAPKPRHSLIIPLSAENKRLVTAVCGGDVSWIINDWTDSENTSLRSQCLTQSASSTAASAWTATAESTAASGATPGQASTPGPAPSAPPPHL